MGRRWGRWEEGTTIGKQGRAEEDRAREGPTRRIPDSDTQGVPARSGPGKSSGNRDPILTSVRASSSLVSTHRCEDIVFKADAAGVEAVVVDAEDEAVAGLSGDVLNDVVHLSEARGDDVGWSLRD